MVLSTKEFFLFTQELFHFTQEILPLLPKKLRTPYYQEIWGLSFHTSANDHWCLRALKPVSLQSAVAVCRTFRQQFRRPDLPCQSEGGTNSFAIEDAFAIKEKDAWGRQVLIKGFLTERVGPQKSVQVNL